MGVVVTSMTSVCPLASENPWVSDVGEMLSKQRSSKMQSSNPPSDKERRRRRVRRAEFDRVLGHESRLLTDMKEFLNGRMSSEIVAGCRFSVALAAIALFGFVQIRQCVVLRNLQRALLFARSPQMPCSPSILARCQSRVSVAELVRTRAIGRKILRRILRQPYVNVGRTASGGEWNNL